MIYENYLTHRWLKKKKEGKERGTDSGIYFSWLHVLFFCSPAASGKEIKEKKIT